MEAPSVRFGLWYDFRSPPQWGIPFGQLYRENLEQIRWAETLGYGSVWLSEHHFAEDGYLPSLTVMAGAILGRTREMLVGTAALLLPLHNPVRVAEDAAVLSLLSGGRFVLGVAMGYVEEEFHGFGIPRRNRPSLLEVGVQVIRRAWKGQALGFTGRRYRFPGVVVTPAPEREPLLATAALQEPGIRRAARLEAARLSEGFVAANSAALPIYLQALQEAGGDPQRTNLFVGLWCVVDEDPERAWQEVGPHALYQMNVYVRWGAFAAPVFEDPAQLLEVGAYQALDGEAAAREITSLLRQYPQVRDVYLWARFPGEGIRTSARRVEYFARKVIPQVSALLREGRG